MRHAVRKSRVSIIRKLIKEVKLLRARKHGDEKVVEKCKRKADRLAAEIEALKKIKDDEISKFGITLTKSLPEILNDTTSEPNTRVMARLAFHKFLNVRIQQFKEKFPSFEEHLGPGRKKMSKLQRKERREAINRIRAAVLTTKENDDNKGLKNKDQLTRDQEDCEQELEAEISHSEEENESMDDETQESADEIQKNSADDEINGESSDDESPNSDQEPGSILPIRHAESLKKRKNDSDSESEEIVPQTETRPQELKKSKIIKNNSKEPKTSILANIDTELTKNREEPTESEGIGKTCGKPKKRMRVTENVEEPKECIKITQKIEEPKKSIPIKVVSEEASVKRFTDVIEDKESSEIVKPTTNPTNARKSLNVKKNIDSFFLGGNEGSECVSVVVRELKLPVVKKQDPSGPNRRTRRRRMHGKKINIVSKIDERSDKFEKNTEQQRQSNFSNPRNNADKYSRQKNDFVPNSRNSKRDFGKKHDVQDEELHPSWQARKKQQEMLKQGFQGKKIVFDD